MPLPLLAPFLAAKPVVAVLGFFRKITLRQWLFFLAALAIAFTLYKGYNWVFDRGAASRDGEVAQLQSDLQAEKDRFAKWKADTETANKRFALEQETLRKDLQAKLDLANEQAKQRQKVIIHEIPKYITVADDALCTIPVNFGLVHNATIEGPESRSGHQLSESATGVPGAASSLTLSEYAAVAGQNNSEAVRRGKVIDQWEQWYDASKEQFTRAQQEGAAEILEQSKNE